MHTYINLLFTLYPVPATVKTLYKTTAYAWYTEDTGPRYRDNSPTTPVPQAKLVVTNVAIAPAGAYNAQSPHQLGT